MTIMGTHGFRRLVLMGTLASGLAGMIPIAAYAQHVVTEDEAAKLTLEALTAAPPRPVYRPIYRAYYRPAFLRYGRAHGWHAVTRASYRVELAHHRSRRHRI